MSQGMDVRTGRPRFGAPAPLWQNGGLYPSGPALSCGTGPDAYTPSGRHPAHPAVSPRSQHERETTHVAVKIRLKRMGKIRAPFYRVVVMDSRTKRDGRAIEEIGKYHPTEEPSVIQIDSDRAQYWLGNGAQPTEAVEALLKITGDWQKFKGEPGTEGTLRVAEPKRSKKELYEAALAAAGATTDDASGATTPRKRAAKKVEEAPATAEAPATEAPAAEAEVAPVTADTEGGEAAAEGVDTDADTAAADEAKA
jgi:small subunit ribosomal protein S16